MSFETTQKEEYISKKATQQNEFIEKYPEYDGRGLLIAVIDDGIDVSMPELQKTTTKLPKVVDCFDFTGAGNVDTSTIKKVKGNNILNGLSGRELKIPTKWKNPSGIWHLGSKLSYKLFGNTFHEINTSFSRNYTNNSINDEEKRRLATLVSHKSVLDCIVWFDGKKWRACIITSDNLNDVEGLSSFCDGYGYGFINDKISYCVKIHNNGNLLQIITSYAGHGTLVAKVAAAYLPEEPNKSGLAPGAQIVSMKVLGPNKDVFGSLKSAFYKCIEMNVDIINLSLHFPTDCDIIRIITEMTEKHGIIIVKAVGNSGPLYFSILETYSTEFYKHLFTIGSIFADEKHVFNNDESNNPHMKLSLLSSKGPLKTGSPGVDFTAPGIIVAQKKLINGTSFACANAAGSIACLLSALKANLIYYSPSKLKIILSNTAYLPEGGDILGFGNGVIQIDSAFQNFKSTAVATMTYIDTFLEDLSEKGIFLITVTHNEVKDYHIKSELFKSSEISWILKTTDYGQNFVECSVENDGFKVRITPKMLKSGSINYTEIYGSDLLHPSAGPLFKFPVTVIVPEHLKLGSCILEKLILQPSIPYYYFFKPPHDCNMCIIKLTALEEISAKVVIHYCDDTDGRNVEGVLIFTPKKKLKKYFIPILAEQNYQISIFSSDTVNLIFILEISCEIQRCRDAGCS